MPLPTTHTATVARASEIAAAAGITVDTGCDYQLRDAYNVTYSGAPSHLALVALARPDLTPNLYRDDRDLQHAVRTTARRLAQWFTCTHADPHHAATFAAQSPRRMCDVVAHVVNHGVPDALTQVGPESLVFYTAYLTNGDMDDATEEFPRLIDQPYRSLGNDIDDDGTRLEVTATAADGAEEVAIRLGIEASEAIRWEFVATVPVPTNELNSLLMGPSWALSSWLDDNQDLIDAHLAYSNSSSEQGINTDVRLLAPDTP